MPSLDRRSFVLFAVLVLLAAGVAEGFAQNRRDELATELLDVELSMSGAYDSDVSVQDPASGVGQFQPSGYSVWGVGSLLYTRRTTDVQFHAAGTSAVRHYPHAASLTNQPASLTNQTHTGAIRVATSLPARLGFNLNQTVSYSPAYRYALFPAFPEASEDQPPAIPDDFYYDLDPSSSVASRTSLGLTRRLTRRMTLGAAGTLDHTNFANETARRPDLTSYSLSAQLAGNLNRNDRLTVTYDYSVGSYNGLTLDRLSDNHNVDISLNFNRQLSASQRVGFFILVGGSTTSLPDFIPDLEEGVAPVNTRTVRVTGEAGLVYPFVREWQIRGSANRRLQYVAGVSQPLFVNGFSVEVNGTVKRRMQFSASVRRSSGQSALTGNRLLDTYTGVARVGVMLTGGLQAYAEYLYYVYEEDDLVPDAPIIPGALFNVERQGARAGLVLRVPAFRR
jgi:hypothetical protein